MEVVHRRNLGSVPSLYDYCLLANYRRKIEMERAISYQLCRTVDSEDGNLHFQSRLLLLQAHGLPLHQEREG